MLNGIRRIGDDFGKEILFEFLATAECFTDEYDMILSKQLNHDKTCKTVDVYEAAPIVTFQGITLTNDIPEDIMGILSDDKDDYIDMLVDSLDEQMPQWVARARSPKSTKATTLACLDHRCTILFKSL